VSGMGHLTSAGSKRGAEKVKRLFGFHIGELYATDKSLLIEGCPNSKDESRRVRLLDSHR